MQSLLVSDIYLPAKSNSGIKLPILAQTYQVRQVEPEPGTAQPQLVS